MCIMDLADIMPKNEMLSIWEIPVSIDEDIKQIFKGRVNEIGVIPYAVALSEIHQLYALENGEIRVIIKEELPF